MPLLHDPTEHILQKLDRLDERLDHIDLTLTDNTAILREHQRRSLANEAAVELLQKEFHPLKTRDAIMAALFKGAVSLGSAVAAGLALAKTMGWL